MESLHFLIDTMIWGNKVLNFYVEESGSNFQSGIYLDEPDSTYEVGEPIHIICISDNIKEAKEIWKTLEILKSVEGVKI